MDIPRNVTSNCSTTLFEFEVTKLTKEIQRKLPKKAKKVEMDLKQRDDFLSGRHPPPPPCPDSANVYRCVLCVSLLDDPVQSTCGDRMCRSCVEFLDQSLRQR